MQVGSRVGTSRGAGGRKIVHMDGGRPVRGNSAYKTVHVDDVGPLGRSRVSAFDDANVTRGGSTSNPGRLNLESRAAQPGVGRT
jgi:hypothetical protein